MNDKKGQVMSMVMMEKSDFDRLAGRIEEIAEHIRRSEEKEAAKKADRWISNREAMGILGISSRTLQRYRDIGRIPFFKMGRNCRYRLSDVERALEMYRINNREESPDGLHRQYLVRTGQMPEKSKGT